MSSQTVKTFQEMGGSSKNLVRFAEKDNKLWSAFNPSICKNPNGQIGIVFRSSNYLLGDMQLYTSLTTGYDIINKVYFAELDKSLELNVNNPLQLLTFDVGPELKINKKLQVPTYSRGVEDCRLLWRDGSWHLLGVVLEKDIPVARQGLFRVNMASKTAETCGIYGSVEESRVEKNWGALAVGVSDEFDFIYGPNVVVRMSKPAVWEENINKLQVTSHIEQMSDVSPNNYVYNQESSRGSTDPLSFDIRALRGGTQLIPWNDGYLAVNHITRKTPQLRFNSRTFSTQEVELRDYTHVFVKYALDGSIVAVSNEFTFGRALVEFAAGLIELDGFVHISYGRNDLSSHLASLSVEAVEASLRYL